MDIFTLFPNRYPSSALIDENKRWLKIGLSDGITSAVCRITIKREHNMIMKLIIITIFCNQVGLASCFFLANLSPDYSISTSRTNRCIACKN